ncbi:rCG56404 [Rattus norvegicus]|uniref:RCG56404 n=1 Tax=Rattus norvegicus TaxID=10116 RepID=A6IB12_RAT|nr:rCG56404 [Rattus norvegicus]
MLKLHKPLIYLLMSRFIAKKSGPTRFVQKHPISIPHSDLQPRYPESLPYIYQIHSESWFPNLESMTTNAKPTQSARDAQWARAQPASSSSRLGSEILSYQMHALEPEEKATESQVAASCTGQNPCGAGSSPTSPDPTQASAH